VTLPPNFDGIPHPLHGDGWRAGWSLTEASPDRVTLELGHPSGAWPWSYAARQTIRADEDGVGFELELVNLSDTAMPAGLGFHPYFAGRSAACLRAATGAVWLADPEMLPTRPAPSGEVRDWGAGAPLEAPDLIDNCYSRWGGAADIRLPDQGLAVRLTADAPLGWLHVYSPPGQPFFCVEPVSHRPNALNAANPLAEGVISIAPGRQLQASMRIEASFL
jgi:aldose 1-epimerase